MTNYNKYSKKNRNNQQTQNEEPEVTEVEEVEEIEEPVAEETPVETHAVDVHVTNKTVSVNCPLLNLREEASSVSDILTVLKQDDVLTVVEDGTDWIKIKFNNFEGYVMAEFVK